MPKTATTAAKRANPPVDFGVAALPTAYIEKSVLSEAINDL